MSHVYCTVLGCVIVKWFFEVCFCERHVLLLLSLAFLSPEWNGRKTNKRLKSMALYIMFKMQHKTLAYLRTTLWAHSIASVQVCPNTVLSMNCFVLAILSRTPFVFIILLLLSVTFGPNICCLLLCLELVMSLPCCGKTSVCILISCYSYFLFHLCFARHLSIY